MTARRDNRTQDDRIKHWREIEEDCIRKARESADTHVQVFNKAIAQIARLEVQSAVTEKMKQ